jgi:hypothetical protein
MLQLVRIRDAADRLHQPVSDVDGHDGADPVRVIEEHNAWLSVDVRRSKRDANVLRLFERSGDQLCDALARSAVDPSMSVKRKVTVPVGRPVPIRKSLAPRTGAAKRGAGISTELVALGLEPA